jgi:hypothetical protein
MLQPGHVLKQGGAQMQRLPIWRLQKSTGAIASQFGKVLHINRIKLQMSGSFLPNLVFVADCEHRRN